LKIVRTINFYIYKYINFLMFVKYRQKIYYFPIDSHLIPWYPISKGMWLDRFKMAIGERKRRL
jgi:hypothetical protein